MYASGLDHLPFETLRDNLCLKKLPKFTFFFNNFPNEVVVN